MSRRRPAILGQLEETVALQRYLLSCVDHLDSHGGRGPALLRLFAPLDDDDDDDRAIAAVVTAAVSLFCTTLSRRRGNERSQAAQSSMARADAWCSTPRDPGCEALPTKGASIVSEVLAVEVQCGVRRLDELERTRAIALAMASTLSQLHPLIPPAACPTLRACATLESAAAIEAIRAFFMMPTGLFPACHRKLLRRLLPLFARAAHGGDLDAVATRVLPMLMRPPLRGHLSEGRQRAQLLATVRMLVLGSASLDDAIAGAEALAMPTTTPPRVPAVSARSSSVLPRSRDVFEVRRFIASPHSRPALAQHTAAHNTLTTLRARRATPLYRSKQAQWT
jgi:hypothetical protein